mgnify:CR=1 FL=1
MVTISLLEVLPLDLRLWHNWKVIVPMGTIFIAAIAKGLNKFEILVSCEALCNIFDQFSVWFFKLEFNPLPDLMNTRFTIIEINMQIPDFLDNMAMFTRGWRCVKILQKLVEFIYSSLKHWTCIPKDCWWILK